MWLNSIMTRLDVNGEDDPFGEGEPISELSKWVPAGLAQALQAATTEQPREKWGDDEESCGSRGGSLSEGERGPSGGMRSDIAELGETVASGLAGLAAAFRGTGNAAPEGGPEPRDATHPRSGDHSETPGEDTGALAGARHDITVFSETFATELSRMALNLLPVLDPSELEEDEDDENSDGAAGVGFTDKVRDFAAEIAQHPQTWLDFPLDIPHRSPFELTEAQRDHTDAVRAAVPALEHLRRRLVPSKMGEGDFWRIYFVLLHSRLRPEHAEVLSTDDILKMRASVIADLRSSVGSLAPSEEEGGREGGEEAPVSGRAPAHPAPPPAAARGVARRAMGARPLLDGGGSSCGSDSDDDTDLDPDDVDWAADGGAYEDSGTEGGGGSDAADDVRQEAEAWLADSAPAPAGRSKPPRAPAAPPAPSPPRKMWASRNDDDPELQSAEIRAAGFVEVISPNKKQPPPAGDAPEGTVRGLGMGGRSESYELIEDVDDDAWEKVGASSCGSGSECGE